MRLNQEQLHAIKTSFKDVFGRGELTLFGSRVDDLKKGGDIDLFINPAEDKDDLFKLKLKFLVGLKSKIGEQKIDLVIAPFASEELKYEVQDTGVLLCKI